MSLGGSQTQTTVTENPEWVDAAAQQALGQAQQTAKIGYTPYYGPDVAAFTDMQNAAFAGTNQAASAFGMPTSTGNGMPPPQTFAGGVQGYSSAPLYQQSLDMLRQNNPAQYQAIMSLFIDPQGQRSPQGLLGRPAPAPVTSSGGSSSSNSSSGKAPSTATQRRMDDEAKKASTSKPSGSTTSYGGTK